MNTININGTEFVERTDDYKQSEHVIVICDRGWIFEGRMKEEYKLTDAHVVRKWTNGRGIGGLQEAAHKDEYTLDALPSGISISQHAIIAVLPIQEW